MPMVQKSVNFLDILVILLQRRRLLVVTFIISSVAGVLISLALPKWYRSSATLLPSVAESGTLNLSSLISNLPFGSLGLGAPSEEINLNLAILNSRTMAENLIHTFDLQRLYKQDNLEKTIQKVRSLMRFDLNEDATLTISMEASTGFLPTSAEEDSARHLARRMTAYIVEELDRIYREKRTEKARNHRVYIEKRYRQNLDDLHAAETAYQQFQSKNGAIDLPEQVKAQIGAAATLQAQIWAKEIEVGVLRNYMTEGHTQLARSELELQQLRNKLAALDSGTPRHTNGHSSAPDQLFLPFAELPELGVEYLRLYRELELQQKLLEFLLPQYEQAKIQESKDTPVVQVLDAPSLPILKSRPKRAFYVLFLVFASMLGAAVSILWGNFLHRSAEETPDNYRKIQFVLARLGLRKGGHEGAPNEQ